MTSLSSAQQFAKGALPIPKIPARAPSCTPLDATFGASLQRWRSMRHARFLAASEMARTQTVLFRSVRSAIAATARS